MQFNYARRMLALLLLLVSLLISGCSGYDSDDGVSGINANSNSNGNGNTNSNNNGDPY